MKINRRREELKESIKEAKRIWRKIVRIKKYGVDGGNKNEVRGQVNRKKRITCNHSR